MFVDKTQRLAVEEFIEKNYIFELGKHGPYPGVRGYYAQLWKYKVGVSRPGNYEDCGHGMTMEEAIDRALQLANGYSVEFEDPVTVYGGPADKETQWQVMTGGNPKKKAKVKS